MKYLTEHEQELKRVMINARRKMLNNAHWEMKFRGLTMLHLEIEADVNVDEATQARVSERKRKLETQFTNRQYEIALEAMRKENND